MLASIETRYPIVVEVDYELSGLAETDQHKKIRRPVANLSLKTISSGGNALKETVINCDEGNLLHLQSKLAETLNKLEEVSTLPDFK